MLRKVLSKNAWLLLALPGLVFAHEVNFSGLLEVEAGFKDTSNDGRQSNIVVSALELGLTSQINDEISVHASSLYEEGDTPLEIDTAFVDVELRESTFLSFGQMYVPFGEFHTHQISDSLVQEIGEARDTIIKVGYDNSKLNVFSYIFNGENEGAGDSAENFGLNINFHETAYEFELSYISNLTDSDTIQDLQNDLLGLRSAAGVAAFARYDFGPVRTIYENVQFVKSIDYDGGAFKPSATNIEMGYEFGTNSIVSAAYQYTKESELVGLPKKSILCTYATNLYSEALGFAIELRRDEAYEQSADSTILTIQLAVNL